MGEIKTVGVKELKNNLSAYLREVRRGARILVADRSTVVAELHEPSATYGPSGTSDPILANWIETGVVVPPTREKAGLPVSPVILQDGSAQRLLDQDRDESRD